MIKIDIFDKINNKFSQFGYTANKGLTWHLSTLFRMSHIQFHKFQIILNKMIPILSCYTAMQGMTKKSARICSTKIPFIKRYLWIANDYFVNSQTSAEGTAQRSGDGMREWDEKRRDEMKMRRDEPVGYKRVRITAFHVGSVGSTS